MTDEDPQLIARRAADEVRRKLGAKVVGGDSLNGNLVPALPAYDGDPGETRRVELLGTLASNAGDPGKTIRVLAGRGVHVTAGELTVLREQHSGMYAALADERVRAVEEGIAQTYRELVASGQRLTKGMLDQMNADMDAGVMPRDIDRTLAAITKVLSVGTDKLLTITGRPANGATSGDPMDAIKALEKLGVAKMIERPDIVDAEVVA